MRQRQPKRGSAAARVAVATALALLMLVQLVDGAVGSQVLTHGSRDRHWVALTFDDGWDAGRCAQIADTLRKRRVTATFFPNGSIVRAAPARWRSILRGFVVANHTLTHAWLDRLSVEGIRREISTNEAVIEQALGRPMLRLLRPPYGAYDQQVLQVADALGYRTVLWDVDSGDTSTSSSTTVVRNATRGVNGSIVLMHCGPAVTPAALGSVISAYRARGFEFVDLATMLGLQKPVPPQACRVRNTRTGAVKTSLGAAIRAAATGDRLVLKGTCRGTATIGKDLSVKGRKVGRSGTPTLAGMDRGPVLTVRPWATAKLIGITVRGGAADRASGILNWGRLTLKGVTVRGNESRDAGGAIVNRGRLVLMGGTSIRGNTSGDRGGGVLNRGTLVMAQDASITRNRAATVGGGLYDRGTSVGVVCGRNVRGNAPDDCARP